MPRLDVLAAYAADRSTVSRFRSVAEPPACFAYLPVSKTIGFPLISAWARFTGIWLLYSGAYKKVGGRCPPAPAAALRLPPQTESPDDLLVAFRAPTVQVGEQPSALSDHREQPPPAGVVTAGGPQMLGEVLDSLREEGDLDVRRAGVFGVAAVRGDHLGLVGKGR